MVVAGVMVVFVVVVVVTSLLSVGLPVGTGVALIGSSASILLISNAAVVVSSSSFSFAAVRMALLTPIQCSQPSNCYDDRHLASLKH